MDLMVKPDNKESPGRPKSSQEYNNRMELKEIACESVDWIEPAQDSDKWRAVSNAVMKFAFRKIPENFLTT